MLQCLRFFAFCCKDRRQEEDPLFRELLQIHKEAQGQSDKYFLLGLRPHFLLSSFEKPELTLDQIIQAKFQGKHRVLIYDKALLSEVAAAEVQRQSAHFLDLNCSIAILDSKNFAKFKEELVAAVSNIQNVIVICSDLRIVNETAFVIAGVVNVGQAPCSCQLMEWKGKYLVLYGFDLASNLTRGEVLGLARQVMPAAGPELESSQTKLLLLEMHSIIETHPGLTWA